MHFSITLSLLISCATASTIPRQNFARDMWTNITARQDPGQTVVTVSDTMFNWGDQNPSDVLNGLNQACQMNPSLPSGAGSCDTNPIDTPTTIVDPNGFAVEADNLQLTVVGKWINEGARSGMISALIAAIGPGTQVNTVTVPGESGYNVAYEPSTDVTQYTQTDYIEILALDANGAYQGDIAATIAAIAPDGGWCGVVGDIIGPSGDIASAVKESPLGEILGFVDAVCNT